MGVKGGASDRAGFSRDERRGVWVEGIDGGAVDVEDTQVVVVCATVGGMVSRRSIGNKRILVSGQGEGYSRSKYGRMLVHTQRPQRVRCGYHFSNWIILSDIPELDFSVPTS